MDTKIKVVWLCAFSDAKLRKNLSFPGLYWGNILRKCLGMKNQTDFAVWDTYAIQEFEKMLEGVELHIVTPHSGISHLHEFKENGIFYHVFWSEFDIMIEKMKRKIGLQNEKSFRRHRKIITKIIRKINPDIVHVIGIENKFHSMAVLDLPRNIPVIAQLQTLVSDDRFKENNKGTCAEYAFSSQMEKKILLRSNFIGTIVKRYIQIIKQEIVPDAMFINTTLPLSEPVDFCSEDKLYDFVYFAANINKAADLAIEAFAEATKTEPNITLDIVGGYSEEYKKKLDNRIDELGITEKVKFEGRLVSHDDVIKQIRHSRFALLPLKIDLISGTIREAMANGLPVVTTITPLTPNLNVKRECVMLSKVGDHETMAKNMIRLLQDTEWAVMLSENCRLSASEQTNNSDIMKHWKEFYSACIDYYRNGTAIPESFFYL